MSAAGSVTQWLRRLQEGDRAVTQPLWERYFGQLVRLARDRLRGTPRRAADEEDVALVAFDCFCRGAEARRFPQLADRDDLWKLLVAITDRKAIDLIRRERSRLRGGGPALGAEFLEDVVGHEPTPEFAARLVEEYRRLLDCLGDADLRAMVQWKLEGQTAQEIAARLGCAPRTVNRRLQLARQIWEREALP